VLIARARSLHQDVDFGENFQSRFRKAQAEPVTASTTQKLAAPASPAPAPQKAAGPEPVVTPPAAKPMPRPAVPKLAPLVKKEVRPKKTFPNEMSVGFEELSNQYKNSGSLRKGLGKILVILAQPLLGALSHDTKKKLEAAVQSP